MSAVLVWLKKVRKLGIVALFSYSLLQHIMSKRTATELQTTSVTQEYEPRKTPRASGSKQQEKIPDDDMGEFEDGWEDEFESDEEIVEEKNGGTEGTSHQHVLVMTTLINIMQRWKLTMKSFRP